MRNLILLILFCLSPVTTEAQIFTPPFIISASSVSGPLNGFTHARSITIDHTQVPNTNQTSFPMLIKGTYAYLADIGHSGFINNSVTFNGATVPADLVYTSDSGCTTLLGWEAVTWDNTTGAMQAWVQIPSLSHTADTVIYECYGKASVSSYLGGAVGAAWDANFKLVYHLEEASDATAPDSSSNANNSATNLSMQGTGQIVNGQAFVAASTQNVISPNVLGGESKATLSFWFKRTTSASNTAVGNDAFNNMSMIVQTGSGFYAGLGFGYYNIGSTAPTDTNWHKFDLLYDYSMTQFDVYLDGTKQTLIPGAGMLPSSIVASPIYIGKDINNATYSDCSIDEVQVSNIARSADWVVASYNNQNNPGGFYTVGPQI